jgi:Cys-tRNA(Pro) deacylase
MTTLPAATQRLLESARTLGLALDIHHFPEGTKTAEAAAAAIGVHVGQIVKSLVFLADGQPVMALVSGANRLNTARLAVAAGAAKVARADADAVREATGYAVGGVPPFGHPHLLPVFIDPDLLQYDTVWAAGGTPMTVFPISPQRLQEVCRATTADLKEEQR